eukprot:510193_1
MIGGVLSSDLCSSYIFFFAFNSSLPPNNHNSFFTIYGFISMTLYFNFIFGNLLFIFIFIFSETSNGINTISLYQLLLLYISFISFIPFITIIYSLPLICL